MAAAEPAYTTGARFTVRTTLEVAVAQAPALVSVKVTVPLLVLIGVKVTLAGEAVAEVLLSWVAVDTMVPVTAVIDHVPVDAPKPRLAPDSV